MEAMESTSTTSSRRRLGAIAVLAAVLLVGGIGVAVAQTGGSSTTTPSPTTTVSGKHGPREPGGPGFERRFKAGPGPGFGGPKGAIHGEFVAPDGSGGYRTVAMQV